MISFIIVLINMLVTGHRLNIFILIFRKYET